MRLTIYAIGRMKSGPERMLLDRYLDRAGKAGRQLGVTGVDCREFSESRAAEPGQRQTAEAEAIVSAIPGDAFRIALDEKGRDINSESLSSLMRREMEQGRVEIAFLIGGPDGHGQALLDAAQLSIRFGAMTWPHQIVRVLAAEQIYRTITILAGHPYHRA